MGSIWIAFTGAVIVVTVMVAIGLYVHFSKPSDKHVNHH